MLGGKYLGIQFAKLLRYIGSMFRYSIHRLEGQHMLNGCVQIVVFVAFCN